MRILVSSFLLLLLAAPGALADDSAAGAASASPAVPAAAAPAAAASATPAAAAPAPANRKDAELALKNELRDIHECLHRVGSALAEISREANRRELVAADPMQSDMAIMTGWGSGGAGMWPYQGPAQTAPGPYLPPRVSFLTHSCNSLDGAYSQLGLSLAKLPDLVKASSSFAAAADASRASADVEVLQDSNSQLGGKFSDLRKFCTSGEPDNATLLNSVKDLDQVLRGMDEVAKRLWKDENR